MQGTKLRYVIKFVTDMNKAVKFPMCSASNSSSSRWAGASS